MDPSERTPARDASAPDTHADTDAPASSPELDGDVRASDPSHEQRDRVAALAGLAAEAGYASSSPTTKPPSSPVIRTRWRRRVVLSLLVLVVIAGAGYGLLVGLHRNPAGNTANIPAVITLDLTQTPLRCPAGFTWSPNGRQLAVWGPNQGCQDDSARPTAIIFDAATGKEARLIDIASVIPSRYTRANDFGTVTAFTWSSDGKALVASLVLGLQTAPLGLTQYGLLCIPLDGSGPMFYGPSQPVPQDAVLLYWNVHTGTLAYTTSEPAPALSYQWTADDHIIPSQALRPASFGQTAGGTPIGRAASPHGFSLWQDGQINPVLDDPDGSSVAEQFTTSPLLWSPDGRVLALGGQFGGTVALATSPINPSLCPQLGLATPCQPVVLSPPDAAFVAVLQALARPVQFTASNGETLTRYLGADIAWNSNGKSLATVLPSDQFSGPATNQKTMVTVLSTLSGQALARFTFQCPLPNGCGSNLIPSWSPSGSQLGAFDIETDTVVLWNTTALAH